MESWRLNNFCAEWRLILVRGCGDQPDSSFTFVFSMFLHHAAKHGRSTECLKERLKSSKKAVNPSEQISLGPAFHTDTFPAHAPWVGGSNHRMEVARNNFVKDSSFFFFYLFTRRMTDLSTAWLLIGLSCIFFFYLKCFFSYSILRSWFPLPLVFPTPPHLPSHLDPSPFCLS